MVTDGSVKSGIGLSCQAEFSDLVLVICLTDCSFSEHDTAVQKTNIHKSKNHANFLFVWRGFSFIIKVLFCNNLIIAKIANQIRLDKSSMRLFKILHKSN